MLNRKIVMKEIIKSFDDSINKLKSNLNADACEFKSVYSTEDEDIENLKYHYAFLYFRNYVIIFIYSVNGMMGMSKSILECYLCFDKANLEMHYPIYNVLDIVDKENFDLFTFSLITNGEIMRECLSLMEQSILKLKCSFDELSYNEAMKSELHNNLLKEMTDYYKKNIAIEDFYHYMGVYYSFLTIRFTQGAYNAYLTGNYKKSIKLYKKSKNKTSYEKRLEAEIIRRHSDIGIKENILPDTLIYNIENDRTFKQSRRDFLVFFPVSFLFAAVWGIFFCVIFYALLNIESRNAIYITKIEAFNMILPSFLMGLITSYYSRNILTKIIYKKDYKNIIEMDYVVNTKGSDKFMNSFSLLVFFFCIAFTILTVNCNIKFKEDVFIDNSKFFSVKGDVYKYSDIECLYYKPTRVNSFNETLDFPSYVIMLKSGKEIDLYELEDYKLSEEFIIPIMKKNNINIIFGE